MKFDPNKYVVVLPDISVAQISVRPGWMASSGDDCFVRLWNTRNLSESPIRRMQLPSDAGVDQFLCSLSVSFPEPPHDLTYHPESSNYSESSILFATCHDG